MTTQPRNYCLYVCKILKTLFSGKLLMILVEISVLSLLLPLCFSLTCSSSSSKSNVISTEKFDQPGNRYKLGINGMISGRISNSLYFTIANMDSSYTSYTTLRKINHNNSDEWIISLRGNCRMNSLNIDSNEKNIYLALVNKIAVCRFSSSTGALIDSQAFDYRDIIFPPDNSKLHILSDNSGYYFTGISNREYSICKYTFISPNITLCQSIPSLPISNGMNILKISDTSLFILSIRRNNNSRMLMYKATFGNISPDWTNYLSCSVETCNTRTSQSIMAASQIYSFFLYGEVNYNLYLASMSSLDGSVSALRYKSSQEIRGLECSAINGNDIILSIDDSPHNYR